MASQIASKAYFAGEAAGLRLASGEGKINTNKTNDTTPSVLLGHDRLEKLPPRAAPSGEIHALKAKLEKTMEEIHGKNSVLTVQDLKRLLFRCAATLISSEMASIG
jgi:phosphatidylinositol 4-kinase A